MRHEDKNNDSTGYPHNSTRSSNPVIVAKVEGLSLNTYHTSETQSAGAAAGTCQLVNSLGLGALLSLSFAVSPRQIRQDMLLNEAGCLRYMHAQMHIHRHARLLYCTTFVRHANLHASLLMWHHAATKACLGGNTPHLVTQRF